jgi:glycosyltransferase involved in cell wall biosynthesis
MELRILFLEPFYGGSHKDFADGLLEASRHTIELSTLPARFWKWRMRGAALYFARELPDPGGYDLVLTSDLLSVSDLKAMWGAASPPVIVYFHENQLSYPVPRGQERDQHFGFTNITSCLTADRVIFNSRFQYTSFFRELPLFLRKMPEYRPLWAVEDIEKKSSVLYPGCRLHKSPGKRPSPLPPNHPWRTETPVILWNHRWEFDKQPELFFSVLSALKKEGLPFSVAVAGENFQVVPKPFIEGKKQLGDRIIQYGFIESKEEYFLLLSNSDIIVSTAIQENFGISVIEGIYSGCFPLLPRRLSYPEIVPKKFHAACLYANENELTDKLARLLRRLPAAPAGLSEAVSKFSWTNQIDRYDSLFESVVLEHRRRA